MSDVASPKIPPYRMTLFYGPEPDGSSSDMVYCVFNVKKRSWKGGVQVAVEMSQAQIAHIRERFGFDQWLPTFLVHLPESEREDYLARGQDIFVQQVCLIKLQLAIGVGIQQENSRVPKDFLVAELDKALGKEEVAVKGEILQELDIELPA
jgi:hypothetical protein